MLSLLVAQSENRVIGHQGHLPWRLSADLQRFKRLTMGHHIIMGRLTFESIGRLLPGRTTVVVTRQAEYRASGAVVVPTVPDALAAAAGDDQAFVVGGGQIYEAAWPLARRLYVTQVHAEVAGDTWFPRIDPQRWILVWDQWHPADSRNEFPFSFRIFDRQD